jgi:Protein of unknown function (DUF3662)/FHA domain
MGVMSRFEAAMQGLVEGSFGRVFRARLQPVELAGKLTRALEDNLQVGADRRVAPNIYDVYLSQKDYESFAPTFDSLQRRMQDAIIAVARERNYMLTTRPLLRFHVDSGIITGQTRIETQTVDARALPGQQALGAAPVDETRALTPEEARQLARQAAQSSQAEVLPPAWLTAYRPERGKPLQITRPVLHLGRHLSNDVVVNDKRVSRHHAEIRYEHGQFVLYDLGSTNGVGINGVLTHQPVPLKNNDIISVGSHDYVFQRR